LRGRKIREGRDNCREAELGRWEWLLTRGGEGDEEKGAECIGEESEK